MLYCHHISDEKYFKCYKLHLSVFNGDGDLYEYAVRLKESGAWSSPLCDLSTE